MATFQSLKLRQALIDTIKPVPVMGAGKPYMPGKGTNEETNDHRVVGGKNE